MDGAAGLVRLTRVERTRASPPASLNFKVSAGWLRPLALDIRRLNECLEAVQALLQAGARHCEPFSDWRCKGNVFLLEST